MGWFGSGGGTLGLGGTKYDPFTWVDTQSGDEVISEITNVAEGLVGDTGVTTNEGPQGAQGPQGDPGEATNGFAIAMAVAL